jgi:hypothetical protein
MSRSDVRDVSQALSVCRLVGGMGAPPGSWSSTEPAPCLIGSGEVRSRGSAYSLYPAVAGLHQEFS